MFCVWWGGSLGRAIFKERQPGMLSWELRRGGLLRSTTCWDIQKCPGPSVFNQWEYSKVLLPVWAFDFVMVSEIGFLLFLDCTFGKQLHKFVKVYWWLLNLFPQPGHFWHPYEREKWKISVCLIACVIIIKPWLNLNKVKQAFSIRIAKTCSIQSTRHVITFGM